MPSTADRSVGSIEVVAFDADDTLWHSEDSFVRVEHQFVELLAPYVAPGVDIVAAIRATERRHVPISGYGVKAYTLSLIECAVASSNGSVPASMIGEVVRLGLDMLVEPVRLLDGVPTVLADLAGEFRLVLITKGDLVHQLRKVEMSGLAHHFDHIEVVAEKDVVVYRSVLHDIRVEPSAFCMVGNSVRSDILPVLALGGSAVHVPYEFTWHHEVAEHDGAIVEVASIREVPAIVRAFGVTQE